MRCAFLARIISRRWKGGSVQVTAPGASVRITSPRGTVTAPAIADQGVPAGVAWLAREAAADLVDATGAVTVVNVEATGG